MTLTQMAGILDETTRPLRYLPILKARQGELKALSLLTDPVTDAVTPVIELVEVDFSTLDPVESLLAAGKLADKITRAWPAGRPRIIVDTSGIEVDTDVTSWGIHGEPSNSVPVTPMILRLLRADGVRAVPVIRLSDQDAVVGQVRDEIAQNPDPGACLRIGGEDLDDALVPLDVAVERLLEGYGLLPASVDLILDFGPVDNEQSLGMAARLARFVLPILAREPWRSFALASGAFPVNLGDVAAFSIAEIQRYDRQLWVQLSGMQLPRALDFADYAVTHPLLQTGVAFAAPPQIRYTSGAHWLVMKGRRTDRRGHKQFFDLCGRLVQDRPSEISQANLSWGDEQFHQAASNAGRENNDMGPGNASTWRAIATSHHIGYVLHSLSTRNEP